MAARINPSRGGKPDKLIRDALMIELKRDIAIPDPRGGKTKAGKPKTIKISKLRAMVTAWVNAAIKGDPHAAEKIADRVDGKVSQMITGPGPGGAIPIDIKNLTTTQIEALKERITADLIAKGKLRPRSSVSRGT